MNDLLNLIKELQDITDSEWSVEDINGAANRVMSNYLFNSMKDRITTRDSGIYTVGDLLEVVGKCGQTPIVFRDSSGDWNNDVHVFYEDGSFFVEGLV